MKLFLLNNNNNNKIKKIKDHTFAQRTCNKGIKKLTKKNDFRFEFN